MAKAAPRYAKALLEALSVSGRLQADLPVVQALAALPQDLAGRLADATIPAKARSSALLSAIGSPSSDSVMGRFVALLASRRRLGEVSEIAKTALAQLEARTGIVRGTVLAPSPLSPAQVQGLEAKLSTPGSKVELAQKTDPSIIGGFRVRLGDVVLDATVNNQLNQARRALLSA